MRSRGFPHTELLPQRHLQWASGPDNIRAAVLETTNLNLSSVRDVTSGEHVPADVNIPAYWSEGFRSCAALILRDEETRGVSFTHCWARDEETLHTIKRAEKIPDTAVFIYGSQSIPQYDIELYLGSRGLEYSTIHLETGTEPFGVLTDNTLGRIAVARTMPDFSIVQYQAF